MSDNIEIYFDKLNKNVLRLILKLVPRYTIKLRNYKQLYIMDNSTGLVEYLMDSRRSCCLCGSKRYVKIWITNSYFEGDLQIDRNFVHICEKCFAKESTQKNYHTQLIKFFKLKQ